MPRTQTFTDDITLVLIKCGGCSVHFGMDEDFYNQRQKDGKGWTCPNGCTRTYGDNTDAKKLERERERSASLLAELDQERAALRNTKGQLTKAKKRAANGVCPCRNRSFVNVARHVKTQHPDHVAEVNG